MTQTSMSNADRVRAFYDAWNRRDWVKLESCLARDIEWFHASRHELVRGSAAVVDLLKSSADAFPDAKIEIHAVHQAREFALVEWVVKKSRKCTVVVSEVQEFENGKCIRGTTYGDIITLLLDIEEDEPTVEHIIVELPRLSLHSKAGLLLKRSPGEMPMMAARARAS